ncbi:MAG: DUF58 domain-containing protein [Fuerstiella sp.]|nr:DUF58 domain-containing protein [Fuerstiella sp.]
MSTDPSVSVGRKSVALLEKADSALSRDFCPWANRYVYWLKNPVSVLGLAIVGSMLCGIFLNPFVFFLTGLLLLITAMGVALPWIAVKGIRCNVMFDVPRTRVGQPVIVRLAIQNRWPMPVWGLSLIRGFSSNASVEGDEGVALARVPGWSTVEYSWSFEPRKRGLYPNETAMVETGFPFGLYRAQKEAVVDGNIIVWPATVRLKGVPDANDAQPTEDEFSDRRVGDFGDIMGTRPFRDGDSLRRVHWAQTARQQSLIVTERQAPAVTSVRVVLDLTDHSHLHANNRFVESCVTAAASVCESLHLQHARVELSIGSELSAAGNSSSSFSRVMDKLATAATCNDSPQHPSRRTGFEIRVTTEQGTLADHPHQIVVGTNHPAAWIAINDEEELGSHLPERWRRVCHVS